MDGRVGPKTTDREADQCRKLRWLDDEDSGEVRLGAGERRGLARSQADADEGRGGAGQQSSGSAFI